MKKLLRGLFFLGALAGAAYAARSYPQGHATGQVTVQIVFDDGSTRSLASNTTEGQEFTDIARKLVEARL